MRRDLTDRAADALAFAAVAVLVVPPLAVLTLAEDALGWVTRHLTRKAKRALG